MKRKVITIVLISTLSSLLWIFISLSEEYFTSIVVPVKFTEIPQNYAIADQSVETVSLGLKGQGWQLTQLSSGLSPEFLISPVYKLGRQTFLLKNAIDKNPWLSSTIQVTELLPEKIDYLVDELVRKKVKIIPNITLHYKNDYSLVGEMKLSQDTVTISGAKIIVENIDKIRTKHYEFKNLERGVTAQLMIEEIPGIVISHPDCTVEFDVQKIVDKTFNSVVVEVKDVPRGIDLLLFPNRINVVLRGGINVLGRLDENSVSASVSFSQAINDTTGILIPVVKIPMNTEIVDITPNSLGYIIKEY